MNKKILIGGIVAVIVVIIAIVAIFLLKGKQEKPSDEAFQAAENLQEFMPNYEKEEIANILDEELTDEQLEVMDNILIEMADPEYGEEVTDEELDELGIDKEALREEGSTIYKDTDGEIVIVDLNTEVLDMTDEEAEAYAQQILAEMNNYIENSKDAEAIDQIESSWANEQANQETTDPVYVYDEDDTNSSDDWRQNMITNTEGYGDPTGGHYLDPNDQNGLIGG